MEKAVKRTFLPESFKVETWEQLQPFFEDLKNRKVNSGEELRTWFKDRSELESVLEEDMAWRYVRMTCDTANKEYTDRFNFFVSQIQPHIATYSNALDEKALRSVFLKEMKYPGYAVAIKNIEKNFKIFREENIPLLTELEQEAHKFGAISGAMTVEMNGKELTLQQAADALQSSDRAVREDAYMKIAGRRYKDKEELNQLFTKLLHLRHKVALNADYSNFRDYMFASLGRFDYKPEDCYSFHDAVASEVVPVLNDLAKKRKADMKLDTLRPWDLGVNYHGKEPLKPFNGGEDLLDKTIECFSKIDGYLANCLVEMKKIGHLDLVSRKGKAPGGYNYPLDETGIPFIFMNATSTLRDLVTLVHEGGHAFHSFLTRDLELNTMKHPPSEVAELASMSMELISMEHWDVFFKNKKDLVRAKREHLEGIIQTLPWVATVDKFQHWLYLNPEHSETQRKKEWSKIFMEFSNSVTDWTGLEKFRDFNWQKQLHIYEVPFYYIEYAIAQLGAVAVWKNYRENPAKGFAQYRKALELGYSKPIGAIYKEAGIQFDFSKAYISELIGFVKKELDSLG
jgi:oligoendopeptidase F